MIASFLLFHNVLPCDERAHGRCAGESASDGRFAHLSLDPTGATDRYVAYAITGDAGLAGVGAWRGTVGPAWLTRARVGTPTRCLG